MTAYYIPGRLQYTEAEFRELGLGYALDPAYPFAVSPTQHGPEGTGAIITFGDLPDVFNWVKMVGVAAWMSVDGACPRSRQVQGYEMAVGGHVLMLPVARMASGECAVPRRATYKNGTWVQGEPVAEYADLWEMGLEVAESIDGAFDSGRFTMSFERMADIAARVIMTNYRLGPEEINALGLLTDETIPVILYCLIDGPASLKKKLFEANYGNAD